MNSSTKTVAVGARASALSRAQVQEVWEEIRSFHPEVTFQTHWIETTGDRDLKTSLRLLDKTDFFTREIDQAQLKGEFAVAIHSAKDLPEPIPSGLILVALTQGVDRRDVLVLRSGTTLDRLPVGAPIGTSSLRRESHVLSLRKDLRCVDIRGPIHQRLKLLEEHTVDGLVMAEAALIRLQLTHLNRISLPGAPSPLQGRLAIIARIDDHEMAQLFSCIDRRV